MIKRFSFLIFWIILILLFFSPVFQGKMPVPLDTILGLYHPWRDQVWDNLTTGVPFKNFLITDPVRQQIPYRFLAIEGLKKGSFSLWNPYSFSGTPLSANIQAGLFYSLNFYFIFLPFTLAWTIYIILPPFLGGIFIYYYLRYLRIGKLSSFLGALSFAFSGFFIAWLEWGTLTHVVMWLPLILLAEEKLLKKTSFKWLLILFFAQVSQLLAGHLQISFYVLAFTLLYLLLRIIQFRAFKKTIPFLIIFFFVFLVISVQYIPFLRFITLSARSYDLPDWRFSSWFLPWQNLVQFIVPDFFGNPATLNYWGEWNYGEFVGYIGIIPLIFAVLAIFFRKDKKVYFYSLLLFTTLVFIVPNPVAKLPYILNIPFISTAQPTRLLSLVVFFLSVLAALGFDWYLKNLSKLKTKKIIFVLLTFILIIGACWGIVFFGKYKLDQEAAFNLQSVTRRNLILPTLLIFLSSFSILLHIRLKRQIFVYIFIVMAIFDLLRFGRKFVSFSNQSWFYPQTEITVFLKNQREPFRFMSLDRRIFPPNFSIMYKLEDVSGYDPLYLLSYAKLVQAWNSNTSDIIPGRFNRIITPQNFESFITDLLNVRFILSLTDLNSEKLILRFQEGETRVYENLRAFPRVFFVEEVQRAATEEEVIQMMFKEAENLRNVAVSQEVINIDRGELEKDDNLEIVYRDENTLIIKTRTVKRRLLVLSDIYYPAWKGYIDNSQVKIHKLNLALKGIVVPEGEHIVEMRYEEIL